MHIVLLAVFINVLLAIWFLRAAAKESDSTGEEAMSATLELAIIIVVGFIFNLALAILWLIKK